MSTDNSSTESFQPAAAKKPYEKPSFRYEQVFVTSALSCGKVGNEGQCQFGPPKVS
jgi:hypothetical protein